MKRFAQILLILGSAFLMVVLLFLVVGKQTPAHSASSTIKVTDDHATIQAAIDASVPGDTILVALGTYPENLSITEGITLSGGWDETFTSRNPGTSRIDGGGIGRVISITCATSSTVVTVDGFTITNGDATGLGTPALAGIISSETHSEVSGIPTSDESAISLSATEQTDELKIRLAEIADRGLYPGGVDAYNNFLKKLDFLTNRAEEAQSRSESQLAIGQSASSPDAGGGVFSYNASLHLLNSIVEWNIASSENEGHGGGIYVSQAPPSGTKILGNLIQNNTGSKNAEGWGGGLHVYQSPGAIIDDNEFLDNAGSSGGPIGVGGGLSVDDSKGVQLIYNLIKRNTAQAGWDCPMQAGGGVGGGVYLRFSENAVVSENVIQDNLAALHCGSHTGGLYVYRSNDIQIIANEVIGNWGVLYQVYSDDYGGGIGIDTLENAQVSENFVSGNAVIINSPQDEYGRKAYGAGIYGYELNNSQITHNNFEENIASYQREGYGGGVSLAGVENPQLLENDFSENIGSLSEVGWGGGVHLLNSVNALVQHNHFLANIGGVINFSAGGALATESWGPKTFDTTIDANLFLDNQASSNPDFPST